MEHTYIQFEVEGALFYRMFAIRSDRKGYFIETYRDGEWAKEYIKQGEALYCIKDAVMRPSLYNFGIDVSDIKCGYAYRYVS